MRLRGRRPPPQRWLPSVVHGRRQPQAGCAAWFQGFDAAIKLRTYGSTFTKIRQTMIVPGPGPGPGTTSAPELRGWATEHRAPARWGQTQADPGCTAPSRLRGIPVGHRRCGRVPTPGGDQAVRRAGRNPAGLGAPQARRSPGRRCPMAGPGESAPGARAGLDHGVAQDDDPRDRRAPASPQTWRAGRSSSPARILRPRAGSCIRRSPKTGPTHPGRRTSLSSRPEPPVLRAGVDPARVEGRGGNSILPRPSRGSPHFDPVLAPS